MLVIGSRGSQLALWQARWVQGRLASLGIETRIQIIKTTISKLGGNFGADPKRSKGFIDNQQPACFRDRTADQIGIEGRDGARVN